jgi:hypothetical protein
MDDPFGGWRGQHEGPIMNKMLEIALVLLTAICFTVLDRYVAGCERV